MSKNTNVDVGAAVILLSVYLLLGSASCTIATLVIVGVPAITEPEDPILTKRWRKPAIEARKPGLRTVSTES